MICPECKTDFKPARPKQRFCCPAHKDAFHNREKAEGIFLPECFRPETEEFATSWKKTIKETAAIIYAEGLRWASSGKPLTDEQIFGKPTS